MWGYAGMGRGREGGGSGALGSKGSCLGAEVMEEVWEFALGASRALRFQEGSKVTLLLREAAKAGKRLGGGARPPLQGPAMGGASPGEAAAWGSGLPAPRGPSLRAAQAARSGSGAFVWGQPAVWETLLRKRVGGMGGAPTLPPAHSGRPVSPKACPPGCLPTTPSGPQGIVLATSSGRTGSGPCVGWGQSRAATHSPCSHQGLCLSRGRAKRQGAHGGRAGGASALRKERESLGQPMGWRPSPGWRGRGEQGPTES